MTVIAAVLSIIGGLFIVIKPMYGCAALEFIVGMFNFAQTKSSSADLEERKLCDENGKKFLLNWREKIPKI